MNDLVGLKQAHPDVWRSTMIFTVLQDVVAQNEVSDCDLNPHLHLRDMADEVIRRCQVLDIEVTREQLLLTWLTASVYGNIQHRFYVEKVNQDVKRT